MCNTWYANTYTEIEHVSVAIEPRNLQSAVRIISCDGVLDLHLYMYMYTQAYNYLVRCEIESVLFRYLLFTNPFLAV